MSRIGKIPVTIPKGVQVTLQGSLLKIKGPLGALEQDTYGHVDVKVENEKIFVNRKSDEKQDKAYHGLYQRLFKNMVIGVTQGYKKELEVVGVGYKVNLEGGNLVLQLGYSHPVKFQAPKGIKIEMPKQNIISVSGIDKQSVGQLAAMIRKSHPPEPYKGKGVRYVDEHVKRKVGKTGAK